MPPKRQSYTAKFKLEVVKYAEENSNRKASRLYQVDESCVRKWKSKKNLLEAMPASKCSLRGRQPMWSQVDRTEEPQSLSIALPFDDSSPLTNASNLICAMNDAIYQNIQTALNLTYSLTNDKLEAKRRLMRMFVDVIELTLEGENIESERFKIGRALIAMGNELKGTPDMNDCDSNEMNIQEV